MIRSTARRWCAPLRDVLCAFMRAPMHAPMHASISASMCAATAAALLACATALPVSAAQSWPAHPIRLIVPFPPAGTTDIVARLVAERLTTALGQTVLVDNRAGAGGIIGADMVAKAAPDGYTLLLGSSGPISISPSLPVKPNYDPQHDFKPVSVIATVPTMLVVNPKLPVKTVADLIAYARAHPGKLNFASTGIGATPHLAGELFKSMAKVDMRHVPYKGSAPALNDLIGGQVDLMFEQVSAALPFAQSGRLRALAVGSERRIAALPDLPSVAESGLPGFDVVSWFGILAPADTPAAIVQRLHDELARIMAQPDIRSKLVALGADPGTSTPEAFKRRIATEIPQWAKIIQQSGAAGQ
jgi:tripartite-type tricarboxylate transporter receptor subunit TctC